MIDKNYVRELAKKLYFDVADDQMDRIITGLHEINEALERCKTLVNDSITPSNYPRVKNCSVLRKDVIENNGNVECLNNAEIKDKYVVGK